MTPRADINPLHLELTGIKSPLRSEQWKGLGGSPIRSIKKKKSTPRGMPNYPMARWVSKNGVNPLPSSLTDRLYNLPRLNKYGNSPGRTARTAPKSTPRTAPKSTARTAPKSTAHGALGKLRQKRKPRLN